MALRDLGKPFQVEGALHYKTLFIISLAIRGTKRKYGPYIDLSYRMTQVKKYYTPTTLLKGCTKYTIVEPDRYIDF